MSKIDSQISQKQELGLSEIIIYSVGFAGAYIVQSMLGNYLTYFWTDVALIPVAIISSIYLISRLFDGCTDIFIGYRVDRTKTRYGKARPWILWMALPSMLSLMLLFYVPNISETARIIYAFVTYNATAFFFMTAVYLPMQTLVSLITDDSNKRITMNMLGQAIATAIIVLGNMYILRLIKILGGGEQGYFRFFAIFSVVCTAMVLLAFIGTKERVEAVNKEKEKISFAVSFRTVIKNKWWIIVTIMTLLISAYPGLIGVSIYYMIWIMGDASITGQYLSTLYIAMLTTVIVAAPFLSRIGKINAAIAAMIIQLIGGFLPLLASGNFSLLMVSAILRGAGPAIILGSRLAFLCDVVDYGEWKTGIRTEGLIFSGASMGSKIGMGIGPAIVALMLSRGGYIGGAAVQTQEAINAIAFTFTWWHALCSAAVIVCLFFLRNLEKQMPKIKADLKKKII